MVGGVLYTTAGSRRSVVAIDATTGETLWVHREVEGKRGEEAPRRLSGRGLAYWTDGRVERIVYVTPGYQMIGLDAKTGALVPNFGKGGRVDLKLEDDQEMDPITGDIGLHAAPIIVKDVVIIGAAHTEGSRPVSRRNDKGYVRGYDVRTGKRLWIFHTIPRPGEYGYDTWQSGSEEYTGNTGVWAQMSADEELGLVYLPVEMPTGDYYGGHRPGIRPLRREPGGGRSEDRQAQVALPVHQARHLGLGSAVRADPRRRDDRRPAAQDRHAAHQTGLAVRVRSRDRRADLAARGAQGRGVRRAGRDREPDAALRRQAARLRAPGRVGPDDLIDFTPELKAEGLKLASRFKLGPLFTPPVVSKWDGPLATLMLPNVTGGANWQGGSFDPETGIFYIFTNTGISDLGLVPGGEQVRHALRPRPGVESTERQGAAGAADRAGPAARRSRPTGGSPRST